MTGKSFGFARFFFFCLLIVWHGPLWAEGPVKGPVPQPAPSPAALTGGGSRLSALSIVSGGGFAAGGAVAVKAGNIGGLAASATRLSGGNMSITSGVTPVVITYATAKSGLSAAHCYPVPFKPSMGHTKITFTDLTRAVRIRIYALSGELVRTLGKDDHGDKLVWDARNARGSEVDSGVYLYLIESAAQKKKGKLMIIR